MKPKTVKKSKGDARKQAVDRQDSSARKKPRRGYEVCIYLYYLKLDSTASGSPKVTAHYFFDPKSSMTIKDRITTLALSVHDLGISDPTCHGDSFDDLARRRKSYFVIVVEDESDRALSQTDGLKFGDDICGDLKPDNYGMHTFDRPAYMDVTASNADGTEKVLRVAYCANKMKSKKSTSQGPLDVDEREKFKYYLTFTNKKRPDFSDSGGTNMGPPVPPPTKKKPGQTQKGVQD